MQAITATSAAAIRADANGKATRPGVPAGTYRLMVSAIYNRQPVSWFLKMDLKAAQTQQRETNETGRRTRGAALQAAGTDSCVDGVCPTRRFYVWGF
jgi:hypothetical protein